VSVDATAVPKARPLWPETRQLVVTGLPRADATTRTTAPGSMDAGSMATLLLLTRMTVAPLETQFGAAAEEKQHGSQNRCKAPQQTRATRRTKTLGQQAKRNAESELRDSNCEQLSDWERENPTAERMSKATYVKSNGRCRSNQKTDWRKQGRPKDETNQDSVARQPKTVEKARKMAFVGRPKRSQMPAAETSRKVARTILTWPPPRNLQCEVVAFSEVHHSHY